MVKRAVLQEKENLIKFSIESELAPDKYVYALHIRNKKQIHDMIITNGWVEQYVIGSI